MGARTRRFTSLASGSGKATAVVVCAVMLLAGCGGSGGSASDASTPVIRGDAAATSSLTVSGTPATAAVGATIALSSVGGTGTDPVFYATSSTGCVITGNSLTAADAGTCAVIATRGTETGTASFTFTVARTVTLNTVTFNENLGTGTMASQSASEATPLNENAFTREGYVFDGWAETSNGSRAYADGDLYPFFKRGGTLYARWKQIPTVTLNTVTFNANGGIGSLASQSASKPTALTRNAGAITRSGYTFDGWSTSGQWYADGASYPFTASATLFAEWEKNFEQTLIFYENPVTGTTEEFDVQRIFDSTPLKKNRFEQPGYVFDGWATTADGVKAYDDGALYPYGVRHNLFARWLQIPTVTFNANLGTGTMAIQFASEAAPLNKNTFRRSGYVFDGWATTADGGKAYADGASYPFDANATLYARWLQIPTVTFNANLGTGTGTGTMAPQVASVATPLRTNAFTKPGFVFDGWSTTLNGGKAYADGASYPFTANATLYARWVCIPLRVTVSGKRVSADRAEVTFSAPSSESPWTSFTANSTLYGETATVSQSSKSGKITVSGLQKHQGYRFTVTATNAAGCSYKSAETDRVEKWS